MKNLFKQLENIPLPDKNQQTFIWGAGNTAVLAHQGMLRENLYNEFNVIGYLDKNYRRTLNNLPVESPDILSDLPKDKLFILICTGNKSVFDEIDNKLNQMNIKHCLLDAAIIKKNYTKIIEAANFLNSYSKSCYFRLLKKRITLDPIDEDLYAGESYFGIPEFCIPRPDDVFLDCGAYVGDSLERYIWKMDKFKKIIAIEPDQGNFRALNKRVSRIKKEWNLPDDKIITINAGLDEKTKKSNIETHVGGLSSIQTTGSFDAASSLTFWSIDDLLSETDFADKVSYIKADIESFEYKMLKGAEKTIKNNKPRLAICIYHNAVDMYSILLLIHRINPDYRFSVRHHSLTLSETVLYAY